MIRMIQETEIYHKQRLKKRPRGKMEGAQWTVSWDPLQRHKSTLSHYRSGTLTKMPRHKCLLKSNQWIILFYKGGSLKLEKKWTAHIQLLHCFTYYFAFYCYTAGTKSTCKSTANHATSSKFYTALFYPVPSLQILWWSMRWKPLARTGWAALISEKGSSGRKDLSALAKQQRF